MDGGLGANTEFVHDGYLPGSERFSIHPALHPQPFHRRQKLSGHTGMRHLLGNNFQALNPAEMFGVERGERQPILLGGGCNQQVGEVNLLADFFELLLDIDGGLNAGIVKREYRDALKYRIPKRLLSSRAADVNFKLGGYRNGEVIVSADQIHKESVGFLRFAQVINQHGCVQLNQ